MSETLTEKSDPVEAPYTPENIRMAAHLTMWRLLARQNPDLPGEDRELVIGNGIPQHVTVWGTYEFDLTTLRVTVETGDDGAAIVVAECETR